MVHTQKKRLLPKDIADRPSGEVAEKLFGKELKRELDRIAHDSDTPSPGVEETLAQLQSCIK